MTELHMLAIMMLIAAIYHINTLRRLAPLMSEALVKCLLAIAFWLAYLLTAGQGTVWRDIAFWGGLEYPLIILASLFSLSTVILFALGRAGWYQAAFPFVETLYWTRGGRLPFYSLLVQISLQQEHHTAAQQLAEKMDNGHGSSLGLQSQIYVLQERWHDILALDIPDNIQQRVPIVAAQVQAALALGNIAQAERHIAILDDDVKAHKNVLSYRGYRLSELRILAAKGDLNSLRQRLAEGVPSTPRHILLRILAEGAENVGDTALAQHCYRDAYGHAPKAVQTRLAEKITGELPKVQHSSPSYGTYALFAFIALCFGLQLWLGDLRAWAIAAFSPSFEETNAAGMRQVITLPNHWWRYCSYALVHGGLMHVAMNLWVLIDIGRLYEKRRGWTNMLMSFIFGAVMGAYITSISPNASVGLVGASGGVLGIGGALLADVWRREHPQDAHLLRSLLQWIGIIVLFSVAIPQVSLWGHVGGVVGGLLWGFVRQGIGQSLHNQRLNNQRLRNQQNPSNQHSSQHASQQEGIHQHIARQKLATQIDKVVGVVAIIAIVVVLAFMLIDAQQNGFYSSW